jgi:hypothetical protein
MKSENPERPAGVRGETSITGNDQDDSTASPTSTTSPTHCPFCGGVLQQPPKPIDHELWCRDNHLAAAFGGAA